MTEPVERPSTARGIPVPTLLDLVKFVAFAGITLLGVLLAGAGRVAYTMIMLIIAAALVYAAIDLVDYEMVKKKRPGSD
jgi:hypothetical protein